MNPQKGISAAERLRDIEQEELMGMLIENADEPYAAEIARGVVNRQKQGKKIETNHRIKSSHWRSAFLPPTV